MDFSITDFNGATPYFATSGATSWTEIETVLRGLLPQFQPSDQAGKLGVPIFDPKGTNAKLTSAAAALGWSGIPIPPALTEFGDGWDGGKGVVLTEWQFSNYPFLWNNVIRSEAVYQSKTVLTNMSGPVEALIVVTKSGSLPASNSTLYYEQAVAQLNTVTTLGVFSIPIRLVGLMVASTVTSLTFDWNTYTGRYARVPTSVSRTMNVRFGTRAQKYGVRGLQLY